MHVLSSAQLGKRQIAGYMQDYWKILGLDIPVPGYGHLSDLFSKLDITVKKRCKRLARRLANGKYVTVIIDSTGLSFDRASQWYEEKYGRRAARTPWRKIHLEVEPDMNIHAIKITGTDVSNSEGMDRILPMGLPLVGSSPTKPTTASSKEKR